MLVVEIYDKVLVLLGQFFVFGFRCPNQGNDSKYVDTGHQAGSFAEAEGSGQIGQENWGGGGKVSYRVVAETDSGTAQSGREELRKVNGIAGKKGQLSEAMITTIQ